MRILAHRVNGHVRTFTTVTMIERNLVIETLSKYEFVTNQETGEVVINQQTGNPLLHNKITGEVTEGRTITLGPGDQIITQEQRDQQKRYAEQQTQKRLSRTINGSLGRYFFVSRDSPFQGFSNETAGRLMYLATFLKIGSDKYDLYLTERKRMCRGDLPKVMGALSRTTLSRFCSEVLGRILYEDADRFLSMDGCLFKRGNLVKGQVGTGFEKAYIDSIRKLYHATPVSQHGKLGLMFKMLPYLNIEYNILCWNPEEKDLSNIQKLSLSDFCVIANCSPHNLGRLMNEYKKITFDVNGRQEYFCSFVLPGGDRENTRIFINPHILYSGSNYTRVEMLGAFCQS